MKKYPFIFLSICLLYSCTECQKTKLDSDDYNTKSERIEILKLEINCFSVIKDAEFELFNVNGFHNQRILVPGSTSLDYKFAIKLDTSDIKKWTKDLTEVKLKDYDDEWTKQIIKNRKQNWRTKSKPQYFTRKGANVTVLVFKNEGILFKRVSDL